MTFLKFPPPEFLPKTTKLCLEVKINLFSSAINLANRDAFTAIPKVIYFQYLSFTGKSVSSNCILRHWTTTEDELVQLRKSNWIIWNAAVNYYKNIFKDLQIFDKSGWPERKLHNSTILLILCEILHPWATKLWMCIF